MPWTTTVLSPCSRTAGPPERPPNTLLGRVREVKPVQVLARGIFDEGVLLLRAALVALPPEQGLPLTPSPEGTLVHRLRQSRPPATHHNKRKVRRAGVEPSTSNAHTHTLSLSLSLSRPDSSQCYVFCSSSITSQLRPSRKELNNNLFCTWRNRLCGVTRDFLQETSGAIELPSRKEGVTRVQERGQVSGDRWSVTSTSQGRADLV